MLAIDIPTFFSLADVVAVSGEIRFLLLGDTKSMHVEFNVIRLCQNRRHICLFVVVVDFSSRLGQKKTSRVSANN